MLPPSFLFFPLSERDLKASFCPRCYCIEPLLRDLHNNNIRLVSQYQRFRIIPFAQPSTSWVAVSVSFVSPFNLRYAESNGKTRILGYRFSFCLLFCLKQLILPILLDDDSLESNSS
ncbi:hypothetical protein BFJ68_g3905 [Fusarium oxysporum]|uniref:Uncharacterized protein n=1 Tax=Fusarium oxysporum TaxID=5507 RepID=A0A420RPF1_FUSOX|nr:hypothetical protein BFJ71_g696 [Fusarium oxysporum]RKL18884.1 hypothetical protein BFJ68_g3905 [Fusarium oxysporum]